MSRRGAKRHLIEAAFAKATVVKYQEAVDEFMVWCDKEGDDPVKIKKFDELLSYYFHELHDSGASKGKAHATFYGVLMYLPDLKQRLPLSVLTLRGWNKLHPAKSYPPLSWELTVLIAIQMARGGWFQEAIGTLLSFDCLLRIGELVGL